MDNATGTARLRLALGLDAIASGACGVLLLVGGQALADLLGMPTGLQWPLGVFLLAYAGALWLIETRPRVNTSAVQLVIAGNALWVVASVLAVALGWLPLTALGTALVLAQAAAVAVLADLEFIGLRRSVARSQAF
jgi:hypothetical protein